MAARLPRSSIHRENCSMLSVTTIYKDEHNRLELGDLIDQCRSILGRRVGVSITFA